MTQTMIDQLTQEEYSHFLAYGDPKRTPFDQIAYDQADGLYSIDSHFHKDGDASWISTLESTTYPDMTFGYIDQL